MADVSASAAKAHVLKGSGDVSRISKDAVVLARELAQKYLTQLGTVAAESARADKRKTVMPQDLQAAAGSIGSPSSAQSYDNSAA